MSRSTRPLLPALQTAQGAFDESNPQTVPPQVADSSAGAAPPKVMLAAQSLRSLCSESPFMASV